jgi:hypothetical protein
MKNNILGMKKKFGSKNLTKLFDLENKYLFQVFIIRLMQSMKKYAFLGNSNYIEFQKSIRIVI